MLCPFGMDADTSQLFIRAKKGDVMRNERASVAVETERIASDLFALVAATGEWRLLDEVLRGVMIRHLESEHEYKKMLAPESRSF